MTYAKQTGRQCPEYIVARVQVADINAAGDSATETVTLAVSDIPVNAIPLTPIVAIDTGFNGTAVIDIGVTGDVDGLATASNITEATPGAYAGTGAEVGQLQTSTKEVLMTVTSTTTITTGDLRIIIPYVQDGRADSVFG